MDAAPQTATRPMALADIRAVMEIEMVAFTQPWSALAYHCELQDNPCAHYLVLETCPGGTIVGYAGIWHQGERASITRIAVQAPLRRAGLGSVLLERLIQSARSGGAKLMTLELRSGNLAAHNFYTKHGFAVVEVMPGYYCAPQEDGLLMARHLE